MGQRGKLGIQDPSKLTPNLGLIALGSQKVRSHPDGKSVELSFKFDEALSRV